VPLAFFPIWQNLSWMIALGILPWASSARRRILMPIEPGIGDVFWGKAPWVREKKRVKKCPKNGPKNRKFSVAILDAGRYLYGFCPPGAFLQRWSLFLPRESWCFFATSAPTVNVRKSQKRSIPNGRSVSQPPNAAESL